MTARVSFDFIIGEPLPMSKPDFDDIWGAMQTAADSVGLELTGAVWEGLAEDAADE